jgi:hypothetical protein
MITTMAEPSAESSKDVSEALHTAATSQVARYRREGIRRQQRRTNVDDYNQYRYCKRLLPVSELRFQRIAQRYDNNREHIARSSQKNGQAWT